MMPEDVGRAARVVPDAGMSQMPLDEPEPELQTDDIRVSPQAVDSDDIIMAPPLTRAGRPKRRYRLPARYEDILPEGPAPIPPNDNAVAAPTSIRRVILHVHDVLRTGLNRFGIMRECPHRPSYDPDAFVKLKDLSNYSKDTPKPSESLAEVLPPPWPFKNMSIYLLMDSPET